jgi:murein DD-endopeptidase MepM/ murein hydrolase activator NlpD
MITYKHIITCFTCFVFLQGVTAQQNINIARSLQAGKQKEDTSFVYLLPYKPGTRHLMVQGYYSKHSHQYMAALDFKMKTGTTICAARGGLVNSVTDTSNKGGLNVKYMSDWNYIIIRHEDGSTALYGHLKKNGALVKAGDTVKQGQPIALSGNTGYSAFPHLHFQVWNNEGEQIATRFRTQKENSYLKPLRYYKSVHE